MMSILIRSIVVIIVLTSHVVYTAAFQTITHMSIKIINDKVDGIPSSPGRRRSSIMMAGGFLSSLFGDDGNNNGIIDPANAVEDIRINSGKGATNEVVKTVNGMKQRRLGGSDIIVSELGLGTQRW